MCSFMIQNITDDPHDTLTINGLVRHRAVRPAGLTRPATSSARSRSRSRHRSTSGAPTAATCVAAGGNGISPTPYTGVTSCTLPFGSRLNVLPFSFYTVKAADFGLPGHVLADPADAELARPLQRPRPGHRPTTNCNPNPPDVGAASQTIVTQLPSTTTTDIHNAAHTRS